MKVLLILSPVFIIISCKNYPDLKDRRIYGGDKVLIEKVPYLVSISEYDYQICGGSIIDNYTILTAAHCTNGLHSPSVLRVKVGATKLSEGINHLVDKIIQHPNYTAAKEFVSLDYDISVLKLKKPIIFNNKTQPIALQDSGKDVPRDSIGIISGWGTIYENNTNSKPKEIYKAEVFVISTDMCKQIYEKNRITDRMICAGDIKKDSCDGDSGGPLVFDKKLIGIISWGEDCADLKYPGVYTKISALRNWIDENIK